MRVAFTLIELVFVIVVIGIISALSIPRLERDTLIEVANQLVSSIRYTQHLALIDNRFDPTDRNWHMTRWQLLFGRSSAGSRNTNGEYAYSIFSDHVGTHAGGPDISEIAVNPMDSSKLLSGGYTSAIHWDDARATKELNVGMTYGIKDVVQSGCGARRIAFDYLGRPIRGNISGDDSPYISSGTTSSILTTQCVFTLCLDDPCSTAMIRVAVEPISGYAHIVP